MPITIDQQPLGTLCIIDPEPRRFSEDDVAFLSELAQRVEEEFAALAAQSTCALTGLCNRRGLQNAAQHLLRAAKESPHRVRHIAALSLARLRRPGAARHGCAAPADLPAQRLGGPHRRR